MSLKDARGPLALALDIGSSSVRALCFDLDGRSVAGSECQIAYALAVTGDGGVTADAPALFEIARSCLDGALTKVAATPCAIACVGVSCFWHSLMGVDAAGKPTTPVLMYSDTRSADAVSALRRDYDQRDVHVRTGCVIHSSYWPAKLRWLRATSPRAVARTAHWQSFAEYALARICGAGPTSVSMASATGLLDIRRAVWDPDALEMAGIDVAALLPIAERTEPLGPIRRALAARWPALAAAAWYPALGDGACANVGVGALSRKRIALTVGTSGAMRVAVPAPPGAALTIPEDLWAYRLDRGSVLLGGAITNGGKVAAWLGDLFAASFDGPAMDAAWAMEPDGHGLTFLPFLAGERSPIWNDRATGVVAGLTLGTGEADLLRAGHEAVAYRFSRMYDALRRVAGPRHKIVASGGAVLRSPQWLQMFADCLGHPIVPLPPEEESSARGAALMALAAAGLIDGPESAIDPAAGTEPVRPDKRRGRIYAAAKRRQETLERLLFVDGTSWDEVGAIPPAPG